MPDININHIISINGETPVVGDDDDGTAYTLSYADEHNLAIAFPAQDALGGHLERVGAIAILQNNGPIPGEFQQIATLRPNFPQGQDLFGFKGMIYKKLSKGGYGLYVTAAGDSSNLSGIFDDVEKKPIDDDSHPMLFEGAVYVLHTDDPSNWGSAEEYIKPYSNKNVLLHLGDEDGDENHLFGNMFGASLSVDANGGHLAIGSPGDSLKIQGTNPDTSSLKNTSVGTVLTGSAHVY